MLGLEPGDERTLPAGTGHRPEADEGRHLVEIAPDRTCHRLGPGHIRVALVGEECRLPLQTQQHAVEQREPARVAMADDRLRQFQEASRHSQLAAGRVGQTSLRGTAREQIVRLGSQPPCDIARRHALQGEPARLGAPARKVGRP